MTTRSRRKPFPSMSQSRPLFLITASVAIAALFLLVSCSDGDKHSAAKVERPYTGADYASNQAVKMPSFVSATMAEGYQFALAHPDQLQYIPCYCGCGLNARHKNNLDCYIAGVDSAGTAVFDEHASFCDICMEITLDVKRLGEQGKSLREIRAYVDKAHGEKGPATETPLPPL